MGEMNCNEAEAAAVGMAGKTNNQTERSVDDGERNREHSTDPGRKERDSH